ncbi:YXWGXW repeat-containing protein [Luteibacter sp.]|uniref:YXWGXW repeat-containing protein n=1 Tax=Luteibacter sp. TaxID=1886636 RepID=UPI003F820B21
MRLTSAMPLLALATALAVSACTPQPRLARNETLVKVDHEPPQHPTEEEPAERVGWVWARGYWQWDGHDYTPVRGHWERERPGYHYVHPFWEQRNGRWVFHAGVWAKD